MFTMVDTAQKNEIAHLERSAVDIREFQPVYVLSRLRTFGYQHAITNPRHQLRYSISTAAAAANPRRVTAVMNESALWFRCADPAVMAEQMRHLLRIVTQGEPTIRVVPHLAEVQTPIGHAFHLYDRRAVVVGILGAKLISYDAAIIATYADAFASVAGTAVAGRDASLIIANVRRHYLEVKP